MSPDQRMGIRIVVNDGEIEVYRRIPIHEPLRDGVGIGGLNHRDATPVHKIVLAAEGLHIGSTLDLVISKLHRCEARKHFLTFVGMDFPLHQDLHQSLRRFVVGPVQRVD